MEIQRIDYFSRLMKNYFIDEKSNEVPTLCKTCYKKMKLDPNHQSVVQVISLPVTS